MIGSIEEPEVKICVPENETRFLREKFELVTKDKVPVDLLKKVKLNENSFTLNVSEVSWIRENVDLEQPLHEWLSKCQVKLPEPPVIPRSPELEARVQRLRLEQQQRDYDAMTRNVDSRRAKYADESIASQVKEMNRQLVAVAQFIVSVAAGFAFGFIGVELIVGELDFGFRLLLGIVCALTIALAEIYFLAKILADDIFPPPPVPPSKPHQE